MTPAITDRCRGMQEDNPFNVNNYVSPDLFCDRDTETKAITNVA